METIKTIKTDKWDYVDSITAVFGDDINNTYNEYFCETYGKLENSFSF